MTVKERKLTFSEYTQKLSHWVDSLFTEKKSEMSPIRTAVSLTENELLITAINHIKPIQFIVSTNIQIEDFQSSSLVVTGILKKNHLVDAPIDWILSIDDYQLFLIEALPVAAEELRDALQWRVRSLINHPLEEAIIDYFTLPPKKNTTTPIIAAVVAKRSRLLEIVHYFEKINADLQKISIPELVLRNLAALHETDDKSTCVLYFYKNTALMNISRKKTLYFTYRLTFNHGNATAADYEQLSLEIMRYFDYFQAQWRHPSPSRIFVLSTQIDIEKLVKGLSEQLIIPVEPYTVPQYLLDENTMKQFNPKCLFLLGSVL